ncbi:hypothetical protein F4804DRAFT_307962 [Jackrogersella minutella]|nr:hypothetical protein F4804DRAFT_307962 [Jackrogersella minutella]
MPNGGLNGLLQASSGLRPGTTRHNKAPMPAEDDEIPLDSSSQESQSSSDISMSDSDDDDEVVPLISTGNERIPIQPSLPATPATLVSLMQKDQSMSRKRKSAEDADAPRDTVTSTKKVKLDREGYDQSLSTITCPSDKYLLPAEIWHRIFSFIPPRTLGNLLCTNKLFNEYLDPSSRYQCKFASTHSQTSVLLMKPDAIWQVSRRRFWPRMPAPLQQKTELDMWRLACGNKCQYCDKADSELPHSPGGHHRYNSQPVWAFGVRSCGPCLVEKTIKEIDLLLSSSVPSLLMSALPFALITNDMRTISPDALQKGLIQPDLQVTRIYLSEHVERLKQEFLSVKAMGGATAEEWLKGLEPRGKELLNDQMRWEKWASTGGGVAQMQVQLSTDSIPSTTILGSKGQASMDVSSLPPRSHSSSTSVPKQRTPDSYHIAPISTAYQSTHIASTIQNDSAALKQSLLQQNIQPNAPRARTREEALELKAARRAEIERRAMELNPPLPTNILARIPSFQAAIQIISPLDDNAWDMLKPRLLAQRADAEEVEKREQKVFPQSHISPEQSEGRRNNEENSIAAKQLIDKTWDDIQAPLRARISAYADEIIRDSWDDGRKVDTENSPQFAADVLLYVRRRFYAEIAKESVETRAAGQAPVEDPPEGPFTQKLTLENMKWLFDVKIKPATESYRKDLFFCNSCEVNYKAFGFEGVIQHYAAKHTTALSLGSVVVHWRAEWPEIPPFKPDTSVVKTDHPLAVSSYGTLQSQSYAGPYSHNTSEYSSVSNLTSFQPPPYFTVPPPNYEHSVYEPTTQQPAPYGQRHPYIPGQHDYSSSYPLHPSPYNSHGPTYTGSQLPFSPGIQTGPTIYPPTADVYHKHNYNARQSNSQVNLQNSHDTSLTGKYHAQLEYLARSSRELWTSTAGLKELSGDIRVCVVIYHIVQRFRSKFFESPPLTMFIDGLSNNKEMRPVRNVNSLMCKACNIGLGDGLPTGQTRRTFSLPQLVNHFQQKHVDQLHATGTSPLDWTVNMVHTPDLSMLSNLRYLTNMDNQKFLLISNAFPLVQHLDGYPQGVTSARYQDTGANPVTASYASQQTTDGTLTPQFPSFYEPSSLNPMAEHDSATLGLQDPTRATISSQKLDPNQFSARGTPISTAHQRFQGDLDRESSDTWQGSNLIRSRKQKGNSKDHRTHSGQGFKSRKGGVAATSARAKSQEPREDDLVAEEDRRQEEEIRAMWAADRKETARLASQNHYSVQAGEVDIATATLEAERPMSSLTDMPQGIRSPTYSARLQDYQQPVIVQEREEDDLIAGLETQLDKQQASPEYIDYRSRHTSGTNHEPSHGRYVVSGQRNHLDQGHPYKEVRSRSPVYVRHNPGSQFNQYREGSSESHPIGIRTATTLDDVSYNRSYHEEYHHVFTDDPRARQPSPKYAETFELVRVRDPRGEYFIRRPIRLEREPAYPGFQDRRAPYGEAALQYRTYENDDYASSRIGYEPGSRTETSSRQPPYEISGRSASLSRRAYETVQRDDPAGYEDYDPRFPAAPPGLDITRQVRYR